ncbi:MAG TPA: hypothetical protein PLU80_14430, partial [Acidobacteriota bacterium]|nr:hypothetical protein [Acidobacteriota bacterium]
MGTPPDLGSQWFAPGWALEADSDPVLRGIFGFSVASVVQRPSGREPLMGALSGGRVSKAPLATYMVSCFQERAGDEKSA